MVVVPLISGNIAFFFYTSRNETLIHKFLSIFIFLHTVREDVKKARARSETNREGRQRHWFGNIAGEEKGTSTFW